MKFMEMNSRPGNMIHPKLCALYIFSNKGGETKNGANLNEIRLLSVISFV